MRPIKIVAASSALLLCCASAFAQEPPAASDDGKLEPLIASVPEYPATAGSVRGHVEVEFTVTPAGLVESPRVVSSEPGTVFDRAALSAVARRRYAADERAHRRSSKSASSSRPRARAAQPSRQIRARSISACARMRSSTTAKPST